MTENYVGATECEPRFAENVKSTFHVSTLFCFNYEMPKSVRKKARPRGRIVMEALGWNGDVEVSPLLGCFGER